MFVITNGRLITEEAVLYGYDLLIEEDRITKIAPKGEIKFGEQIEVIDAAGGYISPGFIDIHSDYIEHMAAPRPTSLMNFDLAIRETEKQLIAHGITTMFHSLSLFKGSDYEYKPIREPENVRKFIDLIDRTHSMKHLVRHRFHARFEIDNVEEMENLKSYIKEDKVHLVSFMDHTPGQGQYRHLEIYRNTVKSYNNISDSSIDVLIHKHQTKEKLSIEDIKEIAQLAHDHQIAVASHDDDSLEKLELVLVLGRPLVNFPSR